MIVASFIEMLLSRAEASLPTPYMIRI